MVLKMTKTNEIILNVSAVIVAGGRGTRMKSEINKQFIKIQNKEVLSYTVDVFENIAEIKEIIIVIEETAFDEFKTLEEKYGWKKIKAVVNGGDTRQASVYNGIKNISDECDIITIHDGARPFIEEEIILNSIRTAEDIGACGVGVPVKDTLKICDENQNILSTPKREEVWQIQTPQTFKKDLIIKAYEKAENDNYLSTDDTALIEYIKEPVKIIMGDYNNIKITTQEDILIAETIVSYKGLNKKVEKVEKVEKITKSNQKPKKNVIIYTDGACSGNPGAGGYGVVMMYNGGRRELSEGFELTTNNRMEMLAVIKGLEALKKPCKVDLYSDSKYVVDAIEKKWVDNWQAKNWVKSDRKPVLNKDLWIDMIELLKIHETTFHWVKGHSDNIENERCDQLAREAILSGLLKNDENYNKNIT